MIVISLIELRLICFKALEQVVSFTCRLTRNLKSFFHRLKRYHEINVAHCLKSPKKSINQDKGFGGSKSLKELRIATPRQTA
jgi:hypothetical protein